MNNAVPFENYPQAYAFLRVGNLNRTMDDETIQGTQRDRGKKGKVPAAIRRRYGRLKDFDYRVFTPRLVSHRADGTHFVIDGNGSNHWVEMLFGPETEVPCIVFEGLTLAEEADLYIKAQDGKAMSKMQIFDAELTAGAETATLLVKVAEEYGFSIDTKKEALHLSQAAARFIFDNYDEDGLRATFEFVKRYFGSDPDSYNGGFFMGIGQALHRVSDPGRLGFAIAGLSSVELREQKSGYAGRDTTRTKALALYDAQD